MKPEQLEEFKKHLAMLFKSLKEKLHLKESPSLKLLKDGNNANKILARTGHYDPKTKCISLYINDRHPKDVLRSFAHEVIHHWQNENGKFSEEIGNDPKYAQNDPNLRKMEVEAYAKGNMLFRNWEDDVKYKK